MTPSSTRLVEGAVARLDQAWRRGRRACSSRACRARSSCPWLRARWPRAASYDAIVALGCVIRGDTPHFEYVAGECASGLQQVELRHRHPHRLRRADRETVRAGARARLARRGGNKGGESMEVALEMADLHRQAQMNKPHVHLGRALAGAQACDAGALSLADERRPVAGPRQEFATEEGMDRADGEYFRELVRGVCDSHDSLDCHADRLDGPQARAPRSHRACAAADRHVRAEGAPRSAVSSGDQRRREPRAPLRRDRRPQVRQRGAGSRCPRAAPHEH